MKQISHSSVPVVDVLLGSCNKTCYYYNYKSSIPVLPLLAHYNETMFLVK